jgi:hypothetical protein
MKIAFGISLLVNVGLVALLIFKETKESPGKPTSTTVAYCDSLKKDLDFFIEGLTKGNDPFFTPITIKTLGSLLPSCFPGQTAKINAILGELREHLLYLVAANTSQEQKRQAHDDAL